VILIAGSANLDYVVRAPRIPQPGETVLGTSLTLHPGGKGANQAVACARAGGVPTRMLLGLGADSAAGILRASLTQAGVELHELTCPALPTGCAFITVDDRGENAITVVSGANAALAPTHLPPLHGASHLLMQLEIPLPSVLAYAQAAQAAGVRVVLNAAPAQALPPELLAAVDVLVVNAGELAQLVPYPMSLVTNLAQLSVPCVVVTLGAQGCLARLGNTYFAQAGFSVSTVDTTGAGDTFCGVLVAALAQNLGLQQALLQASAAAALACTQPGAQNSIPTQQAVEQYLASHQPDPTAERSLRATCGLDTEDTL
jgi:ribokinase